MKFVLLAVVLFTFAFMLPYNRAFAYDPFSAVCDQYNKTGSTSENAPTACSAGNEDPVTGSGGLILKIARLISLLTGIVSVVIVILAGLKYVTANGDSNSINSAKNTIVYALVGLVVSVAAQGIIVFALNRIK